jgi:hypothetical protein
MSSSVVEIRTKAREVWISDDELTVSLADGRKISVPLAWFPRLLHATADQRQNFELLGDGQGIHWPAANHYLRRFKRLPIAKLSRSQSPTAKLLGTIHLCN